MKLLLRLIAIFTVLFGFDIIKLNTDGVKELYNDTVDGIFDQDVFTYITNTGGGCSGVWISSNLIITARHCIANGNKNPKSPFPILIREGKLQPYSVNLGIQGIPVSFSPGFWDSFSILRVKKGPRKLRLGTRIAKSVAGPLFLKCFPYRNGGPKLHRDVIFRYSLHYVQRGSVIITAKTGGGGCSGGGLFNMSGELVGVTIWGVPTALGTKSIFYNVTPYADQINWRINR